MNKEKERINLLSAIPVIFAFSFIHLGFSIGVILKKLYEIYKHIYDDKYWK